VGVLTYCQGFIPEKAARSSRQVCVAGLIAVVFFASVRVCYRMHVWQRL